MKGRGTAFGAVSIVNAIAGGKGATASIALKTEAVVEIEKQRGPWRVTVNGKEARSRLAVEVVRGVLESKGFDAGKLACKIETESTIPPGTGLKSSSSSSVAVALAALGALGESTYDATRVLNYSVEASLSAGVSITGALDDAASCLMGGINHADNLKRRVIKTQVFESPLRVVIKVPKQRNRRDSMKLGFVRRFSNLADAAFVMSLAGDIWNAMILNGIIYSSILRYDPAPALRAVNLGALGAGLSGTGPSVAAVFRPDDNREIELLRKDWSRDGSRVIVAGSSNEHGRIACLD
jgi:shikimate kinase